MSNIYIYMYKYRIYGNEFNKLKIKQKVLVP